MTNSNCIQKVWCPICTYSQARCLRAGFSFHKQLHEDDITSPLLIQIFLLLSSLFSLSIFKHWQKRWHSLLRFGKQCLHDCCWFVYRDFFYNILLQVELLEVTRLRSGEVWSKMETLRKLFFPGEAKAWPDDVLLLKQRSAHGIFRNICEDEWFTLWLCNSRLQYQPVLSWGILGRQKSLCGWEDGQVVWASCRYSIKHVSLKMGC